MGITNCRTDSGRFLISYDHEAETPSHRPNVLAFCRLLRAEGLDVHIDADVEDEREDWSPWMLREINARDGAGGDPVFLSAPGHAFCPELEPRSGPVGAPPRGSAGPTVGAHGRIYDHSVDNSVNNSIDNSDTFHIAARGVTVHRGQG